MKLKIIIVVFIFSISLDAQYRWSNPTPSASKLFGIQFVDSLIGWSVGEFSTALKTTDGGNSWIPKKIPIWSTLRKVNFINKNKGWIIGGDEITLSLGSVLLTTDDGENWTDHNPEGNFGWNDLCVLSEDIIYIGGFKGIYKSTDGGYGWLKVGGTNWTTTVFFIDSLNGWFGNTLGDIYRTTDGGSTWNQSVNMKYTWHKSLRFIDTKVGYLVSGGLYSSEGKIFKSIDGGLTWALQDSISGCEYKNLEVSDSLNVTAIGENGLVKYTIDGGKTWFTNNLLPDTYYDVTTQSSKTWIVGGGSHYCRIYSGNHNSNWEEVSKVYTKSSINSIDFLDMNIGISVGSNGTILRTYDSGNSWQDINVFSIDLTSISYVNQNSIFIAGRMGEFIKSSDGGNSWNITYPFHKYADNKIKFRLLTP